MSIIFNLRFPGQYYDKDSGQYYNHNRYYNPELGRYMGLANGVSFGLAQPISNLAFGYQTANINSSWYVSGELTSMLTGGAAVGRSATQIAMRNADNVINSSRVAIPKPDVTIPKSVIDRIPSNWGLVLQPKKEMVGVGKTLGMLETESALTWVIQIIPR